MKFKTLSILFVFLVFFSCTSKVEINQIYQHPRKYIDKEVLVQGVVKDVFSLAIASYFTIEDSTGKIYVFTRKPLPAKGERVKIKGKVKSVSLGNKRVVAIKES